MSLAVKAKKMARINATASLGDWKWLRFLEMKLHKALGHRWKDPAKAQVESPQTPDLHLYS